jgi:enoyl-CoA hydratase
MDPRSLEFVKLELAENVAELRISRPKALNALNRQVLSELEAALGYLESQATLAAVILTGEGEKAFVAGADIAEMSGLSEQDAGAFSRRGHSICDAIERFPVPVLGAINGYALGGGCELALACDVLYAADTAKFGQPEVKLGLIPGFGGAVRLPRKIGIAAASEWIYTGEIYSARTAQEVGLVREVLPSAELMPRVREIAGLIAARGPLAIRAAKRVIQGGARRDFGGALGIEQLEFASLFATADMREGTKAFVEKRDPQFKGK